MAGTVTSIRLDTPLADEAAKVLGMKTRTEAVLHAWEDVRLLVWTQFSRLLGRHTPANPTNGSAA